MDIVSRLKQYINHTRIPVTTFADECGIARPSFSQLLNGRNKKVSHELIQKIHERFPDMSVMWLMFGEGNMLINNNSAQISPSEKPLEIKSQESFTNNEILTNDNSRNLNSDHRTKEAENPHADFTFDFGEPDHTDETPTTHFHHSPEPLVHVDTDNDEPDIMPDNSTSRTITFSASGEKKVMNIIVYYTDNSFEIFEPKFSSKK